VLVHPHLPALFTAAIANTAQQELLGARAHRDWSWHSPVEVKAAVYEVAAGLIALGLQPGERVGLISENRPEWVLTDFGAQHAALADVPVYPTLPADQTAFILRDAQARAVFVSNKAQAAKLIQGRSSLPDVEHVICFEPGVDGSTSFAELRQRGREHLTRDPDAVPLRIAGLRPESLATLIYTSGTTGEPKGVMLTHGNFCHNVGQVLSALEQTFTFGYRAVSFLPLCHATERLVTYAYLQAGMSIGYVAHVERVADACEELRPHLLVSVPGVLALIRSRIMARIAKEKWFKRSLSEQMLAWGGQEAERLSVLQPLPLWRRIRWAICDRILFRQLRARLGGQLLAVIVGGAALPVDLCRFYWGIGLPVIEGYGMTEASPVLAVNRRGKTRFGTVGPALPNVELSIAEDGEILAKGPNVMLGYWNRPEETAVTVREGVLYTGDLGRIDPEGFLQSTGRKKEILVLSTGKNVAPRLIEDALAASSLIKFAIAVGDGKPSVGVILVPNIDAVRHWAEEQGIDEMDDEGLLGLPQTNSLFNAELSRLQAGLADFERARRYEFLLEEPTEANGMLTPTRKIRRTQVQARHPALVERIYS
jgi:long-chain acyl-CoA synthetase